MDKMNEETQRQTFREILFLLACPKANLADENFRTDIYKQLECLYIPKEGQPAFRHFYSDIFTVLTMLQRGDKPGTIDTLGENLFLLRDMYREEKPDTKDCDISDPLRKLYDHVSLDIARINYSDRADRELSGKEAISDIAAKVDRLNSEMESAHDEQENLNSDISSMKERLDDAKRLSDEFISIQQETNILKEKLSDAQKEYISILGIFAAVVLAFVGGSMFSSSVLESMSSTNIYRMIFVVDFLAFVVVSLVYLWVSFIMAINGTPKTKPVTRAKIIRWWRKKRGKAETEKVKKFFPITTIYLVCLLVAILDIAAWAVDLRGLVDYLTRSLPWLN